MYEYRTGTALNILFPQPAHSPRISPPLSTPHTSPPPSISPSHLLPNYSSLTIKPSSHVSHPSLFHKNSVFFVNFIIVIRNILEEKIEDFTNYV